MTKKETIERAKIAALNTEYENSVAAYHATKESGNFALWNNVFDKERGIIHPPKSNYERRQNGE